jgi:hypothetical protein
LPGRVVRARRTVGGERTGILASVNATADLTRLPQQAVALLSAALRPQAPEVLANLGSRAAVARPQRGRRRELRARGCAKTRLRRCPFQPRHRLAGNRTPMPLFATDRCRGHLEAAYVATWQRQQRGERPASFDVETRA